MADTNTQGILWGYEAYDKQVAGTWPLNIFLAVFTLDYLVVAGGGGSGGSNGGGGGAGGYLTTTGYLLPKVSRPYADFGNGVGWVTGTDYTGTTGTFVFTAASGATDSAVGGARTITLPEVDSYFEVQVSTGSAELLIGLCRDSSTGGYSNVSSIYLWNGTGFGGLTGGTTLGAFASGDILRIAYKAATNKVYFAKNSVWYADPVSAPGAPIPGTGSLRLIAMNGAGVGSNLNGTFRTSTQNTFTSPVGYNPISSYTPTLKITVGAGGAGGTSYTVSGLIGGSSVLGSITSTGGGGGANETGAPGAGSGGSGGGGNGYHTSLYMAAGTGIVGQGNNGGAGSGVANNYRGGGGGGAGAAGAAGSASLSKSGDGGIGLSSSLSGTATYYAGGGGGGGYIGGTAGFGGLGGGGNGKVLANEVGIAGTANTGGGAGGSHNNFGGPAGGSGIVILRYLDFFPAAASTTGSPIITVTGGYRIYKWTSSGSITF